MSADGNPYHSFLRAKLQEAYDADPVPTQKEYRRQVQYSDVSKAVRVFLALGWTPPNGVDPS